MSYYPLTQVTSTAALDETGMNRGNLTNAFTTAQMPRVAWFEVYHMVVINVPAGAQAQINIGSKLWGFNFPLGGAEWDPQQPMLLQNGQEVYHLWTAPAIGATLFPVVTMWLRYDPSLPGNPAQPGVPR